MRFIIHLIDENGNVFGIVPFELDSYNFSWLVYNIYLDQFKVIKIDDLGYILQIDFRLDELDIIYKGIFRFMSGFIKLVFSII